MPAVLLIPFNLHYFLMDVHIDDGNKDKDSIIFLQHRREIVFLFMKKEIISMAKVENICKYPYDKNMVS